VTEFSFYYHKIVTFPQIRRYNKWLSFESSTFENVIVLVECEANQYAAKPTFYSNLFPT